MKKSFTIKYVFYLLVFCCSVLFYGGKAEAAKDSVTVEGTSHYDDAFQVLKLVNQERSRAGADALTMDKKLLEAAMLRAAECSVEFSHTRPNGTTCFTICDGMYGENIAYGYSTPAAVMNSWMDSSGHRQNILNKKYQSVGIGCFVKDGARYWVQCFGFDTGNTAVNPGNSKDTYSVALTTAQETKKLAAESGGKKSSPLKTKVSGLKVTAGKKKLTVKWNKKEGVDGYRLQVSTSKSFQNPQTYTVKKGTTKKVITKYKGKKLKSHKKYYIRICAYTKSVENGTTVKSYSKWSKTSKKTK